MILLRTYCIRVHVYLEKAPDILFFLIVALLNLLLTELHKLLL